MQRTLTISIDDTLYQELSERIGVEHIDEAIEDILRSMLDEPVDLDEEYRAMAADENREREAREWADGLIEDSAP